jgi:LCP family protein required for cell wall assembly
MFSHGRIGFLLLLLGAGVLGVARWLFAHPGNSTWIQDLQAPPPPPRLLPASTSSAAAGAEPAIPASEAPTATAPIVTPLGPAPHEEILEKPASKAPAAALSDDLESVLLLGVDRRPDARGAGLADSIVIALLDEKTGRAGLISVPRDLWVTIPNHGEDRVNVILGVAARRKDDGLALMRRVLEDTLALPIRHALAVDLSVFERAVDAVGGVEIEVPCAIVDSFLDERVEGGRRRLDVAAGRAHLDGVTAAMYVRSRHGRSDFSRARRQQAVLMGVRDRVLEVGNWSSLVKLTSELERSIQSDLRRIDLLGLGRTAIALDRAHLHGLVLAPPLTRGHRTDDGKSVLIPEREAIAEAIAHLFDAPLPGTAPRAECPPPDIALRGRGTGVGGATGTAGAKSE